MDEWLTLTSAREEGVAMQRGNRGGLVHPPPGLRRWVMQEEQKKVEEIRESGGREGMPGLKPWVKGRQLEPRGCWFRNVPSLEHPGARTVQSQCQEVLSVRICVPPNPYVET